MRSIINYNYWEESTGHGSAWSGKYEGVIISPVNGEVSLYLETNKKASFCIGDKTLRANADQSSDEVSLPFRKGKRYPVSVEYAHLAGGPGHLKLSWSWKGQDKFAIPYTAIGFTRTVQRGDGKIVTVYYFTTEANLEQYIEATIWDPDDLVRPVK
jgi:hypothetical protein